MSLIIPVLTKYKSLQLMQELSKILPHIKFHEVTSPENDPYFKQSPILICDYDLLGPHLYDLTKVKWIQGTMAGVDRLAPFIQKSKPINFQISRFSGDHFGKIMGEYVVANIVAQERNFFEVKENQKVGKWDREGKIHDHRVIFDLTIGILGVGSIGNRIGQILHTLGAKVVGYGRRDTLPSTDEYSYLSEYFTNATLPQFLKKCDYVVSVLPNTPETTGILDNDILLNCQEKGTVLINIGRSNIISEQSLVKALNKKWLSAAIIDVFDQEPLPQNNPLWKMEQIYITPHVAGQTRARDIAEQFLANYELYQKNLPLPSLIDFTTGY